MCLNYDRAAALRYAEEWAKSRNPAFYNFDKLGGDCTNFISQCVFAGAKIMNYAEFRGWFYSSLSHCAPAWTAVKLLGDFLLNNKGTGPQGRLCRLCDIEAGDIIQLDFGRGEGFSHSLFVCREGKTEDEVLICTHSDDSFLRPLSTYAYLDYRCIKITGVGR